MGGRGRCHREANGLWGWVAKVDKLQLLDFITYCYGTDPKGSVLELIRFVNGLDDNKIYGLVAEEF